MRITFILEFENSLGEIKGAFFLVWQFTLRQKWEERDFQIIVKGFCYVITQYNCKDDGNLV